MNAFIESESIDLPRGSFVELGDAAGTVLTCVTGRLWITCDGCPRDFVVSHGGRYLVGNRARVLVRATDASIVRIHRQVPGRGAEPRGRWHLGLAQVT